MSQQRQQVRKSHREWSDTLNEENLCEKMISSGLRQEKKMSCDRGVESYEYKSEKLNDDKNSSAKYHHLKASQTQKKQGVPRDTEGRSMNLKDRLCSKISYNEKMPRSHIKATELDSDDIVAKEITRQLREPKDDIIQRCVKVLGKKKSLEILYATEDVQEKGGMLISDGLRKRSPGGVYLQLIKKDDSILNMQRSEIFIEDTILKKNSKKLKRLRQRARLNEAKSQLERNVRNKEVTENKPNEANSNNNSTIENQDDNFNELCEEKMIYFADE